MISSFVALYLHDSMERMQGGYEENNKLKLLAPYYQIPARYNNTLVCTYINMYDDKRLYSSINLWAKQEKAAKNPYLKKETYGSG